MAISPDNHRVLVTITKEQNRLLEELGRFQGRSKGSYLRELLDGAEPLLGALLPILRAAAAQEAGQPLAVRDVVAKVLTGDDDQDNLFRYIERLAERAEAEEADRRGPQRKRGPKRSASSAASSRKPSRAQDQ